MHPAIPRRYRLFVDEARKHSLRTYPDPDRAQFKAMTQAVLKVFADFAPGKGLETEMLQLPTGLLRWPDDFRSIA